MNLMIVESPNKVAKISEVLGAGWKVAASVGHIRDLPTREQGVRPPEFKPEYEISESKRSVVAKLKTMTAQAVEVYLATDPDREGEAISWHLMEALKLSRYKRITFDAINEVVIKKAFGLSRQIDLLEVRSQEARRVLDRLVGWLISPYLCRAAGVSGLTAGRVQSPAVRLVVERERAIQIFKVTNHFGAQVAFGTWVANWDVKPFLKESEQYLMDDALAAKAAAARSFVVMKSEGKDARSAPPAPFRSATLMQAASAKLGFSPSKAMELAQNLFAVGHINYHRTDKQNFGDESIADIRTYAAEVGLPVAQKVRKWRSVEGAQEGHEAIRPIKLAVKEAGESPDERALYKLIWERAIASQLEDAVYKVNDVELCAAGPEGQEFVFKARGRVLVSLGWKSLTPKDAAMEDEDQEAVSPDGSVPLLQVGAAAAAISGRVLAKATEPPRRFKDASLIEKLEALGIGRPSTYPTIIKNIKDREYVVDVEKSLQPTQRGMQLVVALVKARCAFIEYSFTADMEKNLDRIAKGEITYLDVVGAAHEQIRLDCEKLKAATVVKHPCPKCGQSLLRMLSAKNKRHFWGCSAFQETGCDGIMADVDGKPGERAGPVLSKYGCPDCKKPLVHRVVEGKYNFWACSGYPTCKRSFENKDGKPVPAKK